MSLHVQKIYGFDLLFSENSS